MRMVRSIFVIGALVAGIVPVSAEIDLSGRWTGRYQCGGQDEAILILEFKPGDGPLKYGVLNFEVGGEEGSYAITGRKLGRRQFRIVPGEWIVQPIGKSVLALSGDLDANGSTMDGTLQGCQGGRFRAERVGGASPAVAAADPGPKGNSTPPVLFGGAIGGTLAGGASAEAQCRALAAWYAPVAVPGGFDGLAAHKIKEKIAPIFADSAFLPVFGVPHALLDQREGRSVATFLRRTCYGTFGMEPLRNVFVDVFSSPIHSRDILVVQERAAEADRWTAVTRDELARIGDAGHTSLGELRLVENDIRRMSSRVAPETAAALADEATTLRAKLEAAARQAKADSLVAQLDAAGSDFDSGHLGTALRVADEAVASDMSRDQIDRVVDAARRKADDIIRPERRAAAALAKSLPATLDGLIRARAALRPLEEYRAGMDRSFGSLDPHGELRPLYDRVREIEGDQAVLFELKEALYEAAHAHDGPSAVDRLAAELLGPDLAPGNYQIAELVAEAREIAEVAAVAVEDRSAGGDAAEPSAAEIAAFATRRVQEANATMEEAEQACLQNKIANPVQALACLTNPAVLTGQPGPKAKLLKVTKIGCETEAKGRQYLCTFVQEISIDAAGSIDWGALTQQMTSGEAVDARFIRASDGGWSILTGDLR